MVPSPRCQWAACSGFALLAAAFNGPAFAQSSPSAQLLAERASTLRGLATEPADLVAKVRRHCIAGQQPAAIARDRGFGAVSLPDAADYCVFAMQLIGRSGQLMSVYSQLQAELGGSPTGHEQLPAAVASAVLKTKASQVSIGNQRAATITAAIALDSGFTLAYGKGERPAPGMPEVATLKPIAERCLAQAERNLALCYSTGYVYGARAVSGLALTP